MTSEFRDWPHLMGRWQWLEGIGVDCIWVGDHLWSSSGPNALRPRIDAWVAMTSLAAATSRVRVGTLVTSMAYRNPAVVAKQAISVDHLSSGRVELGVGAGANQHDAIASGLRPRSFAGRCRQYTESVKALSTLLVDDIATYRGAAFRFDSVVTAPRAVQTPRPPLIVAGHAESSINLAAQVGDGWSSFAGGASPGRGTGPTRSADALSLTRARVARLEQHARAFGREPGSIRRILLAGFTDDPLWDSRRAFMTFVSRYVDAGIDEFVFPLVPDLDPRTIEQMFTEAVPGLRARA